MKWDWHRFSDKKPRIGDDVLLCFEPGNPYSCDVASLGYYEGNLVWMRIDKTYDVEDTDYWTELLVPDFWTTQIKEDE